LCRPDVHAFRAPKIGAASTTDPDARLYRKGPGQSAKLAYLGHVVMENRHALAVDTRLSLATGTVETDGSQTHRWREMDSNLWYRGTKAYKFKLTHPKILQRSIRTPGALRPQAARFAVDRDAASRDRRLQEFGEISL